MGEEIFRKKSLDKVKSPENLDDYIRVSNPSIWMLLASVIVLLVGLCVWSVFGHVDSTVPATINIDNNKAVCYIPEEDMSSIKEGLIVEYSDYQAVITKIGDKDKRGYECTLDADSYPGNGVYDGKVVVSRIKPISFIMN